MMPRLYKKFLKSDVFCLSYANV